MAKGVGLDIGDYEIKVVELDGSARKPRLAKVSIDAADVGHGGDDSDRAASVIHALKDAGIARDNVCLALPSREAVIRTLTIPFVGEDNIRKVVKFEVEGSIHSHNVDDMVVDFHVLEQGTAETRVMVVATPKPPLRSLLRSLEGVGVEPEVVDLDTMALFRSAQWAGALTDSLTAEDGEAADAGDSGEIAAAVAAPRMRMVIDVGAHSTKVIAVVDGKLVDMRTLRTGTDLVAEELAAAYGVSVADARTAAVSAIATGEDYRIVAESPVGDQPDAERGDDSGAGAEAERAALVPATMVAATRVRSTFDAFLARLRRELTRFLAAVPQPVPIEAVWVTGGGSVMPGVVDVIGEVFGVTPRSLDLFGKLQHDLDADEAVVINPRIAVAFGLALGMMGGNSRLNFRREDLAFARRFDRIKFPLAVACMLGLFLLVIMGLERLQHLRALENEYGVTIGGAGNEPVKFGGVYVARLMAKGGWIEQRLDRRTYASLCKTLSEVPTFEQLDEIAKALEKFKKDEEQKTGYYADLTLESGFAALVRASEVVASVASRLERFLVTDITLELQPQERNRYIELTFALRGDFRAKYSVLRDAFETDAKQPNSPFAEVVNLPGSVVEKMFEDAEAGEEGAYMPLKVTIKPRYGVFQPGGPQ